MSDTMLVVILIVWLLLLTAALLFGCATLNSLADLLILLWAALLLPLVVE